LTTATTYVERVPIATGYVEPARRMTLNGWAVALIFLPPALLLFTVFVALPMIEAGWYSFFNWNGYGRPEKFIGLRNYGYLIGNEALIHEVHTVILGLRRMPKPVVASVRGAVAGFGMSLMMACDLALAADSAYFTLAYTLIGASPDGGSTFALPRIVGQKKAMEIALLGERFDAATAERLGLVNRVIPSNSLEEETTRLAARLAAGPTAVYARTKALLNGSLGASLESQLQREAEAFAQSASEPDFREGLAAFIEKRKPQWHR